MLFTLSYIFLGFYALIIQTVCLREIFVVAYGNELCLGMIFACWFSGVALGAWIAGVFTARFRSPRSTYVQGFLLLCLLFPFQIAGIRLLRTVFEIPAGQLFPLGPLFLGACTMIMPASLLIGAVFPLACQSLSSDTVPVDRRRPTNVIGRMYLAEALGSIAGGVCFTFLLVTRYHAFEIAALMGMIGCLLMALSVIQDRAGTPTTTTFLTLFALFCSAAFGYGFLSPVVDILDRQTVRQRWNSLQTGLEFAAAADSRYGHLVLGKQAGQYALFTNGHYAAAFPDAYGAAVTVHLYLSQHPYPRQVLLIGGGAEGLPAEILKHPVDHLDTIALDPEENRLVSPYLPPESRQALSDPRVTRIYTDGRYYVKQTTQHYDLVILHLSDPATAVLNRFYTLEFFQEVRQILKPDGVVITDIGSSLHLQEDAANITGSLYKTLLTVFPDVLVTPGTTNMFFAAMQPGIITFDTALLAERYRQRQIQTEVFSAYHFETLLWSADIAMLQATLRDALPRFRLNTDMHPITYFYNLLLWTRFSGEQPDRQTPSYLRAVLRRLEQAPQWIWFLPVVGAVLLRGIYLLTHRVPEEHRIRFQSVWAIGTTGFSGMALELVLLLSFQQIYGYLYQKTGFIVAVFMLGLALGGFRSHRRAGRLTPVQRYRTLFANEAALAVFAGLLPWALQHLAPMQHAGPTEGSILGLVALAGALTGHEFPLVGAIHQAFYPHVGRTAGILDSADHLGALCGSLLVGTLLVPLIGIPFTCYLVGALKLSSLILFTPFPGLRKVGRKRL